jgi:hypothetical protein
LGTRQDGRLQNTNSAIPWLVTLSGVPDNASPAAPVQMEPRFSGAN